MKNLLRKISKTINAGKVSTSSSSIDFNFEDSSKTLDTFGDYNELLEEICKEKLERSLGLEEEDKEME